MLLFSRPLGKIKKITYGRINHLLAISGFEILLENMRLFSHTCAKKLARLFYS